MRDRLRAVECPKVIIDQIGGWSSSDVGESYGEGFQLSNMSGWMNKLLLIACFEIMNQRSGRPLLLSKML